MFFFDLRLILIFHDLIQLNENDRFVKRNYKKIKYFVGSHLTIILLNVLSFNFYVFIRRDINLFFDVVIS